MNVKKSPLPVIKGPSYLGVDLEVEGNISCDGGVYINGSINGNIVSQGEIFIGQLGEIEGVVQGKRIVVSGNVQGNLMVSEQLEVLEHGKINGKLFVPLGGVIIRPGAILEGECHTSTTPPNQVTLS